MDWPEFCTRCEKPLKKDQIVWLELDNATNTFTANGVSKEDSQGWFPFGADCAKILEEEHSKSLLPKEES